MSHPLDMKGDVIWVCVLRSVWHHCYRRLLQGRASSCCEEHLESTKLTDGPRIWIMGLLDASRLWIHLSYKQQHRTGARWQCSGLEISKETAWKTSREREYSKYDFPHSSIKSAVKKKKLRPTKNCVCSGFFAIICQRKTSNLHS